MANARQFLAERTASWAKADLLPIPAPFVKYDYIVSDGYACMLIPHTHSGSTTYNIKCTYRPLRGFNIVGKNIFQGAVGDRNWIGGFYGAALYIGTSGDVSSIPFWEEGKFDIELDRVGSRFILKIQSIKFVDTIISGGASAAKMGIFTQTNGSSIISGRSPKNVAIERFAYIDGNYSCDFYPVKNEDTGVPGMYDIVNGDFITNASSGSLTVGNYA